jgi:hypothetical protein
MIQCSGVRRRAWKYFYITLFYKLVQNCSKPIYDSVSNSFVYSETLYEKLGLSGEVVSNAESVVEEL